MNYKYERLWTCSSNLLETTIGAANEYAISSDPDVLPISPYGLGARFCPCHIIGCITFYFEMRRITNFKF